MTPVSFFIAGVPVPKGSAKAFMRPGMRFPVVIQDNRDKQKPWASAIASEAATHFSTLWSGPVWLKLAFYMPRPKGHFGAKGLRPSAPEFPTTKPDLDKLVRCAKDALKGTAYEDDSQVVAIDASKHYVTETNKPGVAIQIQPIPKEVPV